MHNTVCLVVAVLFLLLLLSGLDFAQHCPFMFCGVTATFCSPLPTSPPYLHPASNTNYFYKVQSWTLLIQAARLNVLPRTQSLLVVMATWSLVYLVNVTSCVLQYAMVSSMTIYITKRIQNIFGELQSWRLHVKFCVGKSWQIINCAFSLKDPLVSDHRRACHSF